MTAVTIVALIESATGRENTPTDKRPAPAICVAAADKVQNCGGPGRKPKNLATTFAEKPSTFWILSKPWCTMSAQVPRRMAVMPMSATVCTNSGSSGSRVLVGTTRPRVFVPSFGTVAAGALKSP